MALVTGAGSGIGRAAALAFAREGAAVVLAGRRRAELDMVAAEIAEADGRAAAIPTDVSDEGAVAALVKGAIDRFGQIDCAFNNAGATAYKPIGQLTAADFDQVMATNVRGGWLLVKHKAATGGTAGLSAYAASKGALDAMIRAVALEVGAGGIRINNVSPGVDQDADDGASSAAGAGADHCQCGAQAGGRARGRGRRGSVRTGARFIAGQSIVADGGLNIAGAR